MICAWNSLLDLLPPWLRKDTNRYEKDSLLELRLRINSPPLFVLQNKREWLGQNIEADDISYCINIASRYSPWATATLAQGFLTGPGGHRIGVCGETILKNGEITGFRKIQSLCIRIAKDIPGIADSIQTDARSILIIGAPGWGKTTLLRDLIRKISQRETICVVDERGELFPEQVLECTKIDILTGCAKLNGIEIALRTMGPDRIALDEITASEDADALIHMLGCGVGILATAHATSIDDLIARPIYKKLWNAHIFDSIVILHPDKSYHVERIPL